MYVFGDNMDLSAVFDVLLFGDIILDVTIIDLAVLDGGSDLGIGSSLSQTRGRAIKLGVDISDGVGVVGESIHDEAG